MRGFLDRLLGRPAASAAPADFGTGLIRHRTMDRAFRARAAVYGDGRLLLAQGHVHDRDLRSRLQALRRSGAVPPSLVEEAVPAEAVAAAWRDATGDGTASAAELGGRLLDLLRTAADARASDFIIEWNPAAGTDVQAIVNDRKILIDHLPASEGPPLLSFLFHAKDEGSQQSSYRRTAFQGYSVTASGDLRLPAGVTALRCQRGPHDGGGDHCYARLLYADRIGNDRTLEDLGFTPGQAAVFAEVRRSLHGGVFLGGSTGDGKSTTLATNLALQIAESDRLLNVVTVEDPVEYRIDGALQIAVATSGSGEEREKHFAEALRHFVRIHPASGMVGEIRDRETAKQVLQFIDTGHQVWTSIHVHSANGILFRLLDLGVSEAEVAKPGNIALLVKQTLLPQLCPACSLEAPAGDASVPDWLADRLAGWPVRFRRPEGCGRCRSEGRSRLTAQAWNGYTDTTAAAELIRPDDGYLECVRARDPLAARRHWLDSLGGIPLGRRIWEAVTGSRVDPFDALAKGADVADLPAARSAPPPPDRFRIVGGA